MSEKLTNCLRWSIAFRACVCAALMLLSTTASSDAAPPDRARGVAVIVGDQASKIEVFAADELCNYLNELFGVQVRPTTSVPASAATFFLIGNPDTNPAVRQATAR
jgi:hypothetical protein